MSVKFLQGNCLDVLATLPDQSVNCCVTSPPYWGLRDYGEDEQLGLEETPDDYVDKMTQVFHEVWRVLRDDGTLWLNLGDSYTGGTIGRNDKNDGGGLYGGRQKGWTGEETRQRKTPSNLKTKDLCGIPWRVAFALQADGWYLRQDIIWAKPNPMPESVTDRCTKAHEYVFLLSKKPKYYYDYETVKEETVSDPNAKDGWNFGGNKCRDTSTSHSNQTGKKWEYTNTRNKRSVWTITTVPYKNAHFATFPPKLIEPCILAGCPIDGTVLDPFAGAFTTCLVADRNDRNSIGIELNPKYIEMGKKRIYDDSPLFNGDIYE